MAIRIRRHAVVNPDLDRIGQIGQALRNMAMELKEIFPEREDLIDQILYALMTREHVLIYGTFGTGKSDLVQTLFRCFTGSETFSIEMTKFMSESQIIGAPDVKEMKENGSIRYNPEAGILVYDFAELDEILDATPALLRTMLGILNERIFKRGRQQERVKLHTAVACTNGEPAEILARDKSMGAVLDRFLFTCKVDYLKEKESRMRMYEKFLGGEVPETEITLDDLKYISQITTQSAQIDNSIILETYDAVIDAWVKKNSGFIISDRRRCKLLQLVEANALLFGRYVVDLEDILAIRYGLCQGSGKQFDDFVAIATPIIEKAKAQLTSPVDVTENALLDQFQKDLDALPDPKVTAMSSADLVDLKRKTLDILKNAQAVKCSVSSTAKRQFNLIESIKTKSETVQALIDGPV